MANRRVPSDRPGSANRAGSAGAGGPGAGSAPAECSVAVRVRPGAGRDRVGGRYDGPHGPALVVAVGAPAVDGKATEAVRRALAAALGVRPAAVTLKVGATSRDKVFTVAGDAAGRLAELRDGLP
ncbi:DUF167 domain-containing protein [Actinoplanes sp. NPDC049681]|uniref:DUF167 domain-containing protein n=1 Tax=Actinoplanes sp. NPDC049681 TaxID=3363905 RepID=UPI0037BB35D7